MAELKQRLAQVEAWPNDGQALRWGAYVCRYSGVPHHEERFWRRLLCIQDDPDVRAVLARRAIEQGNIGEAESHIVMLMNSERDRGEGWLLRGVLEIQRLAYPQAITAFETALQLGADQRKARMGCGMAAIGDHRVEYAWERFAQVLQTAPDDAEAINWLLQAGTALQRWHDLVEVLQGFVQRNPADLAVRYALAGVSLRVGRYDLARAQYDTVRVLDSTYEGLPELAKALDNHDDCMVPHAR
jgi:Flp pilus assembly protein TadD